MCIKQQKLLFESAERQIVSNAHSDEDVLTVASQERHKLAEILHDDAMPFGYQVERVLRQTLEYTPEISPRVAKMVEEALDLTSTLLARLRDNLRDCYTAPDEEMQVSLMNTLRMLLQEVRQQYGLVCIFDYTSFHEEDLTPHEIKLFYSIAREAIHNVVKHARATFLYVALQRKKNTLQLVIRDNGQGFVMADSQCLLEKGHLGLYLLRVRAQRLQAALKIESKPGTGTSLVVHKKLYHQR